MAVTGQVFPTALKAFSLFAVFTGALDLCLGVDTLHSVFSDSEPLPSTSPITVFVDSQARYRGTVWAGYGVMLWWVSNSLRSRRSLLAILGATMFIGGIGRLVSAYKYGFSASWVVAATAFELGAPALVYLLGW